MKIRFSIPSIFLICLCSLILFACGQTPQDQADAPEPEKQVVLPSQEPAADKDIAAEPESEIIPSLASNEKLKAGFIYIGSIGDFGWTHAHDQGRKYAEQKFPWLETVFVESVPEADSPRFIERLIQQQGCDVIFTTSFGYMENTLDAAIRHPDKLFMHCSGYKRSDNAGTYFGDLYQIYYLNGIMAGALTKTNKIGYVAAIPIPELIRHINAFALGIKGIQPDAKVHVKWTNVWVGQDKAKEAAEALITEGCDALAFTEDTPAVVEVGQRHTENGRQIYTFSHYSPMQQYGEDSVVSGQLINWGPMYAKILEDIHNKTWTNKDIWWLAKENAAVLGAEEDQPINPKFIPLLKNITRQTKDFDSISVHDLVLKRYAQMKKGVDVFDPFTGPVYDNSGNLKIKTGEKAAKEDLLNMMYYVDNVEGSIPSQSASDEP